MRTLGVHTYLGGFQEGMEEVTEVVGSYETWDRGMIARSAYGLGESTLRDGGSALPKVDLVFANPPCSRFSTTATHHFKGKLDDLAHFAELQDAFGAVHDSSAKALWWETGPLCWSRGRGMVRSVHRGLADLWGDATTYVIKVDLLWAGVPQHRPRTHVIHMAGDVPPIGGPPACRWPIEDTLYEWLGKHGARRAWSGDMRTLEPKGGQWKNWTASELAWLIKDSSTFHQGDPKIYRADDARHANVVLSGRLFCWEGMYDRWWNVDEYAALMSYDPRRAEKLYDEVGRMALTYMSKSVSKSAARVVWDTAFVEGGSSDAVWNQWEPGLWEIKMCPKVGRNPKE